MSGDLVAARGCAIVKPPHPWAATAEQVDELVAASTDWAPYNHSSFIAYPGFVPVFVQIGLWMAARYYGLELGRVNVHTLDYRPGDEFKWHSDRASWTEFNRDIGFSVVAQLSEPDEYEGGGVEFRAGGGVLTLPRARGSVAFILPSVFHRVRPITAGRRLGFAAFCHEATP